MKKDIIELLGNQAVPFEYMDTLKEIAEFELVRGNRYDINQVAMLAMDCFNYGRIEGIRQERSRNRKRRSLSGLKKDRQSSPETEPAPAAKSDKITPKQDDFISCGQ